MQCLLIYVSLSYSNAARVPNHPHISDRANETGEGEVVDITVGQGSNCCQQSTRLALHEALVFVRSSTDCRITSRQELYQVVRTMHERHCD